MQLYGEFVEYVYSSYMVRLWSDVYNYGEIME